MRAAVNEFYGTPDILRIQEIPVPVVGDNEVLVRVFATTINRTDCAILQARPFIMRFFTGLWKPRKTIQGTDFAGEITSIGAAVSRYKIGDRVFGFHDLGLQSHAEYMCLSENAPMAHIPDGIGFPEAAASLEGVHYAYNFFNKVVLHPGQHILVHGGTGAIGSAAVQLAKYYGAIVTATCSTENMDRVASLGADQVIDYTKEDFTQSKNRFQFVFDAVGKSTFFKCKKLLKPRGVYISSELGPWIQNPILALITPLLGSRKVRFPIPSNCQRSIDFVRDLLEQKRFQALIDREYSLEQIADAYRYVLLGQKIGNVIIRIP